MSFRSLRDVRDKKQAKSFVTDPTPSGAASDHIPGDSPPPPLETLGFRYDLPDSMEVKVVPGKGRAIFSTTSSKPGLVLVHHSVSIPGTNSNFKATHCSITDLVCWYCRPQTYQDTALIAVRNS